MVRQRMGGAGARCARSARTVPELEASARVPVECDLEAAHHGTRKSCVATHSRAPFWSYPVEVESGMHCRRHGPRQPGRDAPSAFHTFVVEYRATPLPRHGQLPFQKGQDTMNRTSFRHIAIVLLLPLLGACAQAPASPSGGLPETAAGQRQAAGEPLPTATDQPRAPAGAMATTAQPATSGGANSGGSTITVATDEAYNSQFAPVKLEAPANTQVTLIFKNVSLIHHNLQFPAPIKAMTKLIVPAGKSDTITFTTPAAGTYKFVCSVHEYMIGTLHVK